MFWSHFHLQKLMSAAVSSGKESAAATSSSTSNICNTLGCGKQAALKCPVCLKAGRTVTYCGQDCFKRDFPLHKVAHKHNGDESAEWTHDFDFTGALRPGKLSPKRDVPAHIMRPDYADHPTGFSACERTGPLVGKGEVHSGEALEAMRKVGKFARECLDAGARVIAPGVTTDAIDAAVHAAAIERDCYPSPLNYYRFPKSCCTSVNEVICHGIPDGYVLKEGDIVNIDVTVYHGGYHGDLNETFFVGKVSPEIKALAINAYECMMAGIKTVEPGSEIRQIGRAIQKCADQAGHAVVHGYTGHGIGTLFHGAPTVFHYKNNRATMRAEKGLTFTIEPMINLGSNGNDAKWDDDWTAVTVDGKWSAQFEHTMVVTDTGVELLTARLPTSPPLFLDPEDGPKVQAKFASYYAENEHIAKAAAAGGQ